MMLLQQVPVTHLSTAHQHGTSEQRNANHAEAEIAGSADAHVELQTAHDFDDGAPADGGDCCSQSVDYVSTPNTAISAMTVHTSVAVLQPFVDRSSVRFAATTAPPQSRSLTELSLQQV